MENNDRSLQALLETAGALVVVVDREGRIVGFNRECERVTGYSFAEVQGRMLGEALPAPEAKAAEAELRLHREGLEELVKARAAEVSRTVARLEAEVEDRKRAEARAVAERQLFNDVLETLPGYICLLAPDYHMPFANRYFRETFGESHGRRCYEFLFGLDAPCETCESYTALKTMAPHRWEWTGPNGCDYDIYDFPFTDTDGATLILEMGIDITLRKRAVAELTKSEASLAEAQRIAHLGNWDWNIVTNELAWSDETYRIFGQTPGQSRAAYGDFLEAVHPGDRASVQEAVSRALARERPFNLEHRIALPSGEVRIVHAKAETSWDGAGQPARMVGTVQDITERKRAEEARERMEMELEVQRAQAVHADRLRSLGEMAAGISHELNQPLMGIRNIAEHLLIGIERGWEMTAERVAPKARDIIEQVDRMTHVISHARVFARGGADEMASERVAANSVVRDAVALIGTQLRSRGIALTLDLAPDLPEVLANPYALEEVVLNLVNNARDACQQMMDRNPGAGSEITVRTFASGEGPARTVCVEVSDRGPGMSEEVMERAFEPFYSTKAPGKGTGLGLSICRSIVERFRGTIALASGPGEGARVTVSFPAEG